MMLGRTARGLVLGRFVRTSLQCSVRSSVAGRSIRLSQPCARVSPSRSFHASSQFHQATGATAVHQQQQDEPDSSMNKPITRFSELAEKGLVNQRVTDAITRDMRIDNMTDVQSLTINSTLKGTDVLAQAKTGTGKTLAFLVPVIQKLMEDPRLQSRSKTVSKPSSRDIRAIIVSPTRELAEQIYQEALKVVRHTGLVVQTAVGGTQKRLGLQKIQRQGCHLLVGTPGRLIDLLSDPYSGVSAPNLNAFVLDEADRLLDIGFAPDIARMQEYLPPRSRVDRQTLLFSATVPRGVMDVVAQTMKPDYEFVETVAEDETPTHLSVPQKAVYLNGLENQLPAVYTLAKQAIEAHRTDPTNNRPFKAIVYFNSTSEVTIATSIFRSLAEDPTKRFSRNPLPITMTEMHSKLRQGQRTRNSDIFRRASSAILFSSDVTARGMDFPDVTHIIQLGIPRDRETYIHRLGRTARANKTGEGWIFVTPLEHSSSRSKLEKLPIEFDQDTFPIAAADLSEPASLLPEETDIVGKFSHAAGKVEPELKGDAWRAAMNYALSVRDKKEGLEMVKRLAKYGWAMDELPEIPRTVAQELGRASSGRPDRRGYGGFGSRQRSSGPPRSFQPYDRSGGSRFSGPSDRSRSSGPRFSDGPRAFQDRSRSSPDRSRSYDRDSGSRGQFSGSSYRRERY